jgi:hypothetical protein
VTAVDPRLIELDVSSAWQPPDAPRPRRRSQRWVALSVVALLIGLLVGGSVRRPSIEPELIITGTGVQSSITTPSLLVVLHQPNRGATQLDVYRLRDGATLWSKAFAQNVGLTYADDERVVISDGADSGSVTGLAAATGAPVWQRPGFSAFQRTRSLVITLATVKPGTPEPANASTRLDLVALRPSDGATAWSLTTHDGARTAFVSDRARDELVELDGAGTLRVYDLSTGVAITTAPLVDGRLIAGFDIVGRLLLAVQSRAAELTAYNLENGALEWRSPLVRDGLLDDCGVVLCSDRDGGLYGIDWHTGAQRWHLAGYDAFQQLDDRYLLATAAHGNDRFGVVVDAATGRVERHVPGWAVLAPTGGRTVVVWRPENDGALIALYDRASGRVDVFGTARAWFVGPPQCAVAGAYMACRSPTNLSLWRLPQAVSGSTMG